MKRKEIKKLLSFLDRKDQGQNDFSGFNNPGGAMKSYDELLSIRRNSNENRNEFSPFFTDKVMGTISQMSQHPGLEDYLSMLLNRVMSYGLSAILIIFLTLYFLHGQEGIGTILGTDTTNDINFISYLFYEF